MEKKINKKYKCCLCRKKFEEKELNKKYGVLICKKCVGLIYDFVIGRKK